MLFTRLVQPRADVPARPSHPGPTFQIRIGLGEGVGTYQRREESWNDGPIRYTYPTPRKKCGDNSLTIVVPFIPVLRLLH